MILASAAVLTLIYLGKLILVVVLISILLAFVLAPIVDALVQLQHSQGGWDRCWPLLMLVGALGFASYVSYSRALDFMQEAAPVQGQDSGARRQDPRAGRTDRENHRHGSAREP